VPLPDYLPADELFGPSTPLVSLGDVPFDVTTTQGNPRCTFPVTDPEVLDATFIEATTLELPVACDVDTEICLGITGLALETADGTLLLGIGVPAADLAFLSAGEALQLTLAHGLEVRRQADDALVLAVIDQCDLGNIEFPSPARALDGSGLTFAHGDVPTCFSGAGFEGGLDLFAFYPLTVTGGAQDATLAPGTEQTFTTADGTYRVRHVSGWSATGAAGSVVGGPECHVYAVAYPWTLSYEVVRVE